jgi:hypothetical protein
MFSSRCWGDEVPGMGNITGERFRSQANATGSGVASSFLATVSSISEARLQLPRGPQGINAMPFASQYSTT